MSSVSIPETGYLRQYQVLGDKKRGIPPIYPVSKSTWWAGWQGHVAVSIFSMDSVCKHRHETYYLSRTYQGQSSPAMEVQ